MLEILGKVGFDWQVALANLVNFAIVFVILNFLVFKPLKKVIADRKAKIDQGLEDAEKAQAVLVEASSRKDELLSEAYKESQDILSKAKDQKNQVIDSASQEASEEAAKIRQNAVDEAEMILKKADADLSDKAAILVVAGLEKVLKEKMSADVNESYIKSVLK
jgi:F-type H+-transporting ATPase subunit b